MTGIRLSKYNPALRDDGGAYRGSDWTSVSDIGRIFRGSELTEDLYLHTESCYLEVLESLLLDGKCHTLRVRELERTGAPRKVTQALASSDSLVEGQLVSGGFLERIVRACLREEVWCKLEATTSSCAVHFGYDYYLYVTGIVPSRRTLELAQAHSLFIDNVASPYS